MRDVLFEACIIVFKIGMIYGLVACDHRKGIESPHGKYLGCPFPRSPDVDGDLSEAVWREQGMWQVVNHDMGSDEAENDTDASFSLACIADKKNMYFAFKINDDRIIGKRWKSCNGYENDSFEIYIDACNHCSDEYTDSVSQIIIGVGDAGIVDSAELNIGGCNEKGIYGEHTNAEAYAKEVKGGWHAEVAVPLHLTAPDGGWKIDPSKDLGIGFQAGYNDDDDGDTVRDHRLIWGKADRKKDRSYRNPMMFGELLFISEMEDMEEGQ